ncbi:hypothetical protein VPH35_013365 [Triticum aestivum]
MHLSIFLLYAGYTPDDVYGEAQEQAEAEEVRAHARKVQRAAEVGPRPERRANACVRGCAEHRRIEEVEVAVDRPGRDMHLGASAEGERSRLVWPGLANELKP